MAKDDKKIILLREGVIQSWARDTFTFGTLVGASYGINVLIPPSGWLNFTLALVWLIWIVGRSQRHLHVNEFTPAQARAWLDEKYPERTKGGEA